MNINKIKENVEVNENGCWIWQKSCAGAGYGQLTENGKYWGAHRYAFCCLNTLKESDVIRHKCHTPKCCNPEHLEKGTHKDNWHDSKKVHNIGSAKLRKKWSVLGIPYETSREAVEKTGLTISSICKYTVDGVFNVEAYRVGCKKANKIPKI